MRHGFLTFKDLKEKIEALTAEQQEATATIYLEGQDEFLPIQDFNITLNSCEIGGVDTNVLDEAHPYMVADSEINCKTH